MAQADLNVANQSGSAFRADLNNQLLALGTLMSGASEPSTTYAYMLWADTTTGLLKQRNAANNAWVSLGSLATANLGLLASGSTLTAALGSASTPGVTFTGDLDTGLYSPGANQVALGTNGQQRLAIDSSGRVLVGPGTAREVGGAVIPTLAVETLAQAASFVRNSADTSGGIIALGKSRATTAGGIIAVQDADILGELRFCGANGTDLTSIGAHIRAIVTGEVGTAGDTTDMPTSLVFSTTPNGAATATEQLRITDDRYLRMAASTGGIQFGGDTAAANALDDYEEGTFTPIVEGTTTAGTGTYTAQVGRYTKTGNRVQYNFVVLWTAHTGTGNLRVAGLPFTSQPAVNNLHPAAIYSSNLTTPANHYPVAAVGNNTTTLSVFSIATGGSALALLAMDTAATLYVSGYYEAAT
jgi:hypothetical protein